MKFILFLLIILLTGCNNSNIINNTQNINSVENLNISTPLISEQNITNETNIEPEVKAPVPELLSTFTTTIYTKTEERQNNVKIACNQLNGITVESRQTFSFTETLGPATPENGYLKADSFDEDGDIIQEYGGGKCQISTTLYNAVLAVPSFVVIERHEHSNDVPYIEEGLDAAVAYGSIDFKFRNDLPSTIRIDASCTDDTITISIYKL